MRTGGVGLICALDREGRLAAPAASRATVRVAGVGPGRAAAAARALLERGCDALVSFGFAGSLTRTLHPGAVLVPERVVDEAGGSYEVDRAWAARLRRRLGESCAPPGGVLCSSARVVPTPAAKRALAAVSGACAVDMESAAIAAAARAAGRAFVVLRAVSDGCDDAVPGAALAALDAYGRVRPAALARALARRPWQIPALVGLAAGVARAERALADALARIGPDLARPAPGTR